MDAKKNKIKNSQVETIPERREFIFKFFYISRKKCKEKRRNYEKF